VRDLAMVRTLIRRIVDGVAEGQKYHLKVVVSDNITQAFMSTQDGIATSNGSGALPLGSVPEASA